MTTAPAAVTAWHALVETRDPARLAELLADEIVFRSPAVHTPQEGRAKATAYLMAALAVLGPNLRYLREWYGHDSAVLEFQTELDGRAVHGVDLITWNAAGRLVDFTVMVRPLRGLEAVITHMGAYLAAHS